MRSMFSPYSGKVARPARGILIAMAVMVLAGCSSGDGRVGGAAPPVGEPAEVSPSAATDTVTDVPSGELVGAYIAAQLEQPTLEEACVKDAIGWACNVSSIDPLNDTEMRVTITELSPGVKGVGVAMAFRNFASTGSDAPMPHLVRVVVVNEVGEEVGRTDH